MFPSTSRIYLVFFVWAGVSVCSMAQYRDYNEFGNQPDYNDVPDQNAMHCFQCNSRQDADCINIQPNDTNNYHYKPCLDTNLYNGKQPFCRKIVQRIYERDNMEIVIRKCGWIKHERGLDCYNVKNDDHEEVICQCFTPACNESSGLHSSVAILILTQLASIALWRK